MSWRRLHWLVLPLFLVLAQQGQFRHEIDAHSRPSESQRKAPEGDRCAECLAFAHVAGVVTASLPPLAAPAGLSYHHGAEAIVASLPARPFVARSRGPPIPSHV